MELTIAMIIFAAMIAVWFFLPGTVVAEEIQTHTMTEGVSMTPAKAEMRRNHVPSKIMAFP